MDGIFYAILGAAIAAILPGIGSAIGVQLGGRAAAGVLAEKPTLFGKLLILQALPGTQGIYGFIIGIIVANNLGIISGPIKTLDATQGWQYFAACMPIAIVGFLSAIFQGRTAVSAIHMTAKQPDSSAKGMTMTALVETYAILALLVSILVINGLSK